MLQNLLPVWGVVVSTKIGLELATKNLQSSTLPNTVCSNQTQDLTRTGHRQPMQLEAVGRVSVGDLGFEVGGQIDDIDGVKWAFLRTDTTPYAEAFRYEGNLRLGCNLDAQLSGADHRAGLLAFLSTFLQRH